MTSGHPLIDLVDIRRTYQTGEVEVNALRGITAGIAEGEFAAIVGSSGSGKSTLMHIIGCLDRPTAGAYVLDGEDVSGLSPDRLAEVRNRKIGFVFQGFHLLPRTTAVENVELPLLYRREPVPAHERHRLAQEVLAQVGLANRERHTPAQLSGGQQQRVAIARALVTRPRLLLADEPTGNLDSASSAEIMDLLTALNRQGMTIVLVTHEADVAAYAHRRIHLRDGLIVPETKAA